MAYTYITGLAQNISGGTSNQIDTTGADLIVVAISRFLLTVNGAVISDNRSNTYTQIGFGDSSSYHIGLFVCQAPSVGTGHIFSINNGSAAPSIVVGCFSGSQPSPDDQQSIGSGSGGTTYQAGSITPSQNNELVISVIASAGGNSGGAANTIDSGFTVAQFEGNSGVGVGLALAYLVQTTATAENPTWTLSFGFDSIGINQSFFTTSTQTLTISPIPTAEAWFTPTMSGGSNNLAIPTIPTGERWFSPSVAGPVTPGIIPSGEHWFAVTLTAAQTIHVGTASPFVEAIPSGEHWFTPRVGNVQTATIAAIPTGEHWFTPTISGVAVWVNVAPIPSGERWYAPTVTGGTTGVFLFLSGVDRSQYVSWLDGVVRIQSQTLGRWTATFDLFCGDGSFIPVLGQTVLLFDNGVRLFAGCLQEVVIDRAISTLSQITYHCTATDKSAICDHRVIVGKTYPAIDPTSTLPNLIGATILDIVTNFLNGEGVLPGPEITPTAFGDLSSDLNWNFPTVTAAFDTICQNEGLVWWVDSFSVLHFSPYTDLAAAPILLTETSYNWRNLMLKQTTTSYYNKLYAVSNLNILPGSGSGGTGGGTGQTGNIETFTFTVGQPGIVPATLPNGMIIATGFNVSVSIASVLSMTVNGNAQTVYALQQYTGQTRADSNDFLWFFGQGNTQLSWTYGPPTGATIVIDYVPASTNASNGQYGSALNPLNPSGDPLGTCGSGVYEGVLQVQNIATQDDLNAIASAELARIQGIPNVLNFQTDYPGLAPGQLLSVYIPLIGANDGAQPLKLLVTTVSGVFVPPGPFPLTGGSFRWDVEANSNLDPGNWTKWYERLVRATANPLPVLQYESAVFVLGPGSSLSSGNSITNPYIVGRTGALVSIQVAAATPPTDQTLVLSVTDNNVVIATIQMPPTTAANQLITVDLSMPPAYIFAGDILNINVSYIVTGSLPIAASNVTCQLRFAM